MTSENMQPENRPKTPNWPGGLRQEVAEGLLYTHSRLNANTSKTLEPASFLYALVELLSGKDLITINELDERKRVVGKDWRNGSGRLIVDDKNKAQHAKPQTRNDY